MNSVKSINCIVNKYKITDYRIVASPDAKGNISDINSSIQKINFYTSTAFEGVDIYDEIGKCVVVSDKNVVTSLLDISTLFVQICGRIRDSKYKSEIEFIVNPKEHRYCKYNEKSTLDKLSFLEQVNNNTIDGKKIEQRFLNDPELELRTYNEKYYEMYVNKDNNILFFDENLKNVDIKNFEIINEVYSASINILENVSSNDNLEVGTIITENKYVTPIQEAIENYIQYDRFYTLDEIKNIVAPILAEYGIIYSQKNYIKYLPPFEKRRKILNGNKVSIIIFKPI